MDDYYDYDLDQMSTDGEMVDFIWEIEEITTHKIINDKMQFKIQPKPLIVTNDEWYQRDANGISSIGIQDFWKCDSEHWEIFWVEMWFKKSEFGLVNKRFNITFKSCEKYIQYCKKNNI